MDETAIEERGLQSLTEILDKVGGWRAVVGANWDRSSTWTWFDALRDFRRIGFPTESLFSFEIEPDLRDSSIWRIAVSAMSQGVEAIVSRLFRFDCFRLASHRSNYIATD